jgi:hypothetical protein
VEYFLSIWISYTHAKGTLQHIWISYDYHKKKKKKKKKKKNHISASFERMLKQIIVIS